MLEIRNVTKQFGQRNILNQVNLTINDGEFFSLLGPSGCGKTTLLRILAGLESASSGKILFNGAEIQNLPAQERPFNMVFQRYALFPHMTVLENLNFGLDVKKISKTEKEIRINETLDIVGLLDFKNYFPETLSGGQAQRVALARALVNRPKILLLDEPLSALDLKMREHMQRELRFLQKKLGLIFIYVTHDQDEALVMSDRIGVMNEGKLEQVSSPRELYEKPLTAFTAQFVGSMNKLSGKISSINQNNYSLLLEDGRLIEAHQNEMSHLKIGNTIQIFIRPEKIELLSHPNHSISKNIFTGKVVHSIFKGDQLETYVETELNGIFRINSPHLKHISMNVGETIYLNLDSNHLHLFNHS